MVVLGGVLFLVSEVPLYLFALEEHRSIADIARIQIVELLCGLQGYLAHKKPHPPRTLP